MAAIGSSPHTWGTRCLSRSNGAKGRFIPTHVGNTDPELDGSRDPPVHPHTRGEHRVRIPVTPEQIGSSPHTWGTLSLICFAAVDHRFIPTHVGNTVSSWDRPGSGSVHPHTRGEHKRGQASALIYSGSSPHTWGTQILESSRSGSRRFIPTHVGNTMETDLV